MTTISYPTNPERGDWAALGLRAFASRTGQITTLDTDGQDCHGRVVSDLLTGLMHHCAIEGLDFECSLTRARRWYEIQRRSERGCGAESRVRDGGLGRRG